MDRPHSLRHTDRTTQFELVTSASSHLEAIVSHIEKHIGKPATVLHELVSDLVHVDIHVVAPTPQRNYYTLVTSGMSDRPMNVPDKFQEYRFAEVMICLPADWPMEQAAWKDQRNYWPIELLKVLARFPHKYSTWLGPGHTVPNGDPPRPYTANTKMRCAFLLPPVLEVRDFWTLAVDEQTVINFFGVIPLYREEMRLNLKYGMGPLCDRFDKHAVSLVLDVNRKNVCKKRFWLF
jgi:hypothetical protein